MPPPLATTSQHDRALPADRVEKAVRPESGSGRVGRSLCALGLATVTALALLPGGTGQAEPGLTIPEVERRTQELVVQVDTAVEEYNTAQVALEQAQARALEARADVAAQQVTYDGAREQVGDMVSASYRSGSGGVMVELVTGSTPAEFLSKVTQLDAISRNQAEQLTAVQTARVALEGAQRAVDAEVQAQAQLQDTLKERAASIESDLAAQKSLLEGLRAEERARLEAERRAREEAERQAAAAAAAAAEVERANRSRAAAAAAAAAAPAAAPAPASGSAPAAAAPTRRQAPAAPPAAAPAPAPAPPPVNGSRAEAAIAEGYRQLGKPYQWGGNGPNSFDCSGFTSWSYRAAGVSLPRTSRDQFAAGRKVPLDQLQRGDLVYFGSPIHHVGIYIGDGQMINAPSSSNVVRVQPAFRKDLVGATRP